LENEEDGQLVSNETFDVHASVADFLFVKEKSDEVTEVLSKMNPNVQKNLKKLFTAGKLACGDLDLRCLSLLSDLPPSDCLEVLSQAMKLDLTVVKNKSAYVQKMVANFRSLRMHAMNPAAYRQATPSPSPAELSPVVRSYLEGLVQAGKLARDSLDTKCLALLASLPESSATAVLRQLGHTDTDTVRNMSAFFTSLCRKQMPLYHPSGPSNPVMPTPRYISPTRRRRSKELEDQSSSQACLGVRIEDMHKLSSYAKYVPASVALKLQNLHDEGLELVTLLEDEAWRELSWLEEDDGLVCLSTIGDGLRRDRGFGSISNVSDFALAILRNDLRGRDIPRAGSSHHRDRRDYHDRHGHNNRSWRDRPPPSSSYCNRNNNPRQGDSMGRASKKNIRERFECLSRAAQSEIESLVGGSYGEVTFDMFDVRVIKTLSHLRDHEVREVCNALRKTDPSTIDNFSAFVSGKCKVYLTSQKARH